METSKQFATEKAASKVNQYEMREIKDVLLANVVRIRF